MSESCSLFPPFGDPSCLLPSHTPPSVAQEPVPLQWQSGEMICQATSVDSLGDHFLPMVSILIGFCPENGEWASPTLGSSPFKHAWLYQFSITATRNPHTLGSLKKTIRYSLIVLGAKIIESQIKVLPGLHFFWRV